MFVKKLPYQGQINRILVLQQFSQLKTKSSDFPESSAFRKRYFKGNSAMLCSSGDSPKTALCIGHPGHELRVYEWMVRTRPFIAVLTDGSGASRLSRFHFTADLLQNAGATLGLFQGNYTDRAFYDFILQKSPAPFLKIADRLVQEWIENNIETVAGDMMEGFSPTHDLCRAMINAAVLRVERKTGRNLVNLEFPLESLTPPADSQNAVVITLTDEQFARKRQAALTAYPPLAAEIERLISKYGEAGFKTEFLTPANGKDGLTWEQTEPPYYETYGRQQVALGHYRELITHAEHIRPVVESLLAWAES